jgi:hypothetical protein
MMVSQPWLQLLVIFRSGPLVIRPLLAHQGDASKMQRDTIKNYKKMKKKKRENFRSPQSRKKGSVLHPLWSLMDQHQIILPEG